MCWNWQVSLMTWLIGLVCGIYLIRRNHKYDLTFGSLVLAYSSMQLWETLMWLDQKCGNLNKFANIMAYFALWSHTLAIGYALWVELGVTLPLVIGIGFMITAIIETFVIKFKCAKPASDGCGHLKWGFPHSYYMYVFVVCISICLVYIKPLWKAITLSGLFILSLVLSALYSKESTGSFWCWVCAFFAPLFIIIN